MIRFIVQCLYANNQDALFKNWIATITSTKTGKRLDLSCYHSSNVFTMMNKVFPENETYKALPVKLPIESFQTRSKDSQWLSTWNQDQVIELIRELENHE